MWTKPKPKPNHVHAPKLPRGQVKRNTAAWRARAPDTKKARAAAKAQCGDKCFLVPELNKYPICARGSCETDCDGVRAARNITYLIEHRKPGKVSDAARARAMVARQRAIEVGKKSCGWK